MASRPLEASPTTRKSTWTDKIQKTDAEWRAQLDAMEYQVTRHAATERAFTGKFCDHHEHGIYTCVCCNTPLFASDTKFDSGCGWPSYFKALDPANVIEKTDRTCKVTNAVSTPLAAMACISGSSKCSPRTGARRER